MRRTVQTCIAVIGMMVATSISLQAQFQIGTIQDKDGYSNARSSPNPNAPVTFKIPTNQKFVFFPSVTSEWYYVETETGSGYVHKSRIQDTGKKGIVLDKRLREEVPYKLKRVTHGNVVLDYIILKDESYKLSVFMRLFYRGTYTKTFTYESIEGLGGPEGIYVSILKEPSGVIISKYGDYNNVTIYIDAFTGVHHVLQGGDYFIVKGKETIMAFNDSERTCASFYNFISQKSSTIRLNAIIDLTCYQYQNKYYVVGEEETDERNLFFKEIDFETQTLKKSTIPYKTVVQPQHLFKMSNPSDFLE